jgi:hypothetical protein
MNVIKTATAAKNSNTIVILSGHLAATKYLTKGRMEKPGCLGAK